MDIVLTHITALETLRSPSLKRRLGTRARCTANLPDTVPSREELKLIASRLPERVRRLTKLDLLIAHDAPRTRPIHATVHRALATLPAASAIQIAPGIRCVSPEHLAVQLAPMLTDLELIYLLSELLGTYAITPELDKGMFNRSSPLTTPELVTRHLDALGPVTGTARVRGALRLCCVGSNSPRETKLSLRLGLPKLHGGYDLAILSMNDPLEVRRIHDSMRTGVRKPDILLLAPGNSDPKSQQVRGLAFEYDGDDHNSAAAHARDAARHNELQALGLDEYVITKEQYDDVDYLDGLVKIVRKALGIPEARVTRAVAARRRAKREKLKRELDLIDGIHWNGREREKSGGAEGGPNEDGWDVVPVEAYGLE